MDDMEDSLFEGMVLFNPTSSSSSSQLPLTNNNNNNKADDDSVNLSNHRESTQQSLQFEPLDENLFSDLTLIQPQPQDDDVSSLDPPLSPSSSSTSSRSTTDFASTVVTTTTTTNNNYYYNYASVVPSARSLTSQVSSTRKKKRAGLRIGYGRPAAAAQLQDSAGDFDHSSARSYIRSPSQLSLPVVLPEAEAEEDKQQVVRIVHDPEIRSEIRSEVRSESPVVIEEQVSITEAVRDSESTLEQEVKQVERKEDSVELRYEQVKKQVADKLDSAQRAVAAVSVKRKEAIRKRRKAAEELSLVSVKYKEMEKELEEAVESEDFETAERVSDGLASAEKNKEVLLIALREAEAECDAIDSRMQEALELQIVAEEECAKLLKSFAVDADQNADSVISNAKTKTSEEMEKWDSLSEALEAKKMEAEVESDVISGARQGLDDSINQIVKEDKQKSQLLYKKLKILADELQELLALVKQKEAEISENNLQIEEIEKKMAGAVSNFQDALSDIDLKFKNIQLGLSKLELENEDLCRKKKAIDDFALQEEARGFKIRELAQVSADEASVHQEVINLRRSLIKFISKSREDKIRLATTEQKLFDDVQVLKQDISAVRASLQDLSSTKSGTQQSIESSKQRLLFIEKRVPEIESEKRVFATARNFKEAARIANEAKTLYAEKETLQLKIYEDSSTLKKIEDELNQNVQKLQEKEENVLIMEKELEAVRYKRLVLVASAAKAERSAAMKIGDVEEANILLQEAEVADLEARKIQSDCKNEEIDGEMLNSFVSMELVSTLDKNQLAELASNINGESRVKSEGGV